MTDLTDRYVTATLRGIPEKQRADIERELRATIADDVDARVESGADPASAENAALTELGDPTRLAAGYTGRPLALIGPDVYIAWRTVLKVVLWSSVPVVAVVLFIVTLAQGKSALDALGAGAWTAFEVLVQASAWVTVAFAIVERVDPARIETRKQLAAWTPDKLPPAPTPATVSVGEIAGGVIGAVICIVWIFIERDASPFTDESGAIVPLFTPSLWDFWLPFVIGALVANIVVDIAMLAVGRLTWWLALLQTIVTLAAVLPLVILGFQGALFNHDFFARFGWDAVVAQGGWAGWVVAVCLLAGPIASLVQSWKRALGRS